MSRAAPPEEKLEEIDDSLPGETPPPPAPPAPAPTTDPHETRFNEHMSRIEALEQAKHFSEGELLGILDELDDIDDDDLTDKDGTVIKPNEEITPPAPAERRAKKAAGAFF